MDLVPSEFVAAGVYFPPLLIGAVLGVMEAVASALMLNRYRISRHFFYPPLVFLALSVIYTGLISKFLVPA